MNYFNTYLFKCPALGSADGGACFFNNCYRSFNGGLKRKKQIAKGTILDMIDFIMVQAGITRQQATIAFDTIVLYIKQNPNEPLHKVVKALFGQDKDEPTRTLN